MRYLYRSIMLWLYERRLISAKSVLKSFGVDESEEIT